MTENEGFISDLSNPGYYNSGSGFDFQFSNYGSGSGSGSVYKYYGSDPGCQAINRECNQDAIVLCGISVLFFIDYVIIMLLCYACNSLLYFCEIIQWDPSYRVSCLQDSSRFYKF